MGITLWLPQRPLPGAKASLLTDFPKPWVDEHPPATHFVDPRPAAQDPKLTHHSPPIDKLPTTRQAKGVQQQPGQPLTKQPLTPAGSHQQLQVPESTVSVPYFQLHLTPVSQAGLVVYDNPHQNYIQSTTIRLLLNNLLAALTLEPVNNSPLSFNWPLVQSSQVDQSPMAAQVALAAYLERLNEQKAVHWLLAMGQTAQTHINTQHSPSLNQLAVYQCASIAEMVNQPLIKAQVWADLQPLISHLKLANHWHGQA
jgi:hypothetical protein